MGQKLLELWEFHSVSVLTLARNIVAAALIIIIGTALSKGAQKLFKKTSSKGLRMDTTATTLLRMVVSYGIFIICVIMILNVFGVNTTSLIAVLGAAGVAVGLALKDTLGNIASGIILLFLGTCRTGEFIEFGSYMGTVKEINLFTTILETPDGIYISAPNSSIWGNPLKNYTRNGKRRMELSVGIAYSDSIETAFQTMQNIIAAETRFLKDPAPQVILQSIEDSSIKITIRAWTPIQDYWDIYWDQMRIIKTKIEEAGLHVPLPQRDVRVVNGS
ncbi:MAG: mechanosensitive ion channel family protein [Treponema sp.]|jgi:small conductance mechanosensitive channel|nr:mechanosensitive ion channel family protein [Treponema sp.]